MQPFRSKALGFITNHKDIAVVEASLKDGEIFFTWFINESF